MNLRLVIVLPLLLPLSALAADPWADTVISVNYGPGAGFGQDFFPGNVLGPPDSTATETFPANSPSELLTIGGGGVIVLAFDDGGIVDGPGPDFTVFENPFRVSGGETVFTETAFVAVSADGVSWLEFPWNAETLAGLAGVTPTNGAADPTNPAVSGGDCFDLAGLGLDLVRYVRLTDTDGIVPDGGPSFDLDAVAAIHGETHTALRESAGGPPSTSALRAWPNPFNDELTVTAPPGTDRLEIVNQLGQRVATLDAQRGRVVWKTAGLPGGSYWLRAESVSGSAITRLVKVR